MSIDFKSPQDSDLLLPFETENISKEYLEYYKIKRNNFFSTVQHFPGLWKMFTTLDMIWLREFDDLQHSNSAEQLFPIVLYMNAHAKMRVSIELCFAGCVMEGRSILRDAVEFAAHAHAMLKDPKLIETWLCKADGNTQLEAFKNAFDRNKAKGLFDGLPDMHSQWCELSETGSHANLSALFKRFSIIEDNNGIEFRFEYSGIEPSSWVPMVFTMLLTCFVMEEMLFKDYESRLRLDTILERMRKEFETLKEQLRQQIITKFNLVNPATKPAATK